LALLARNNVLGMNITAALPPIHDAARAFMWYGRDAFELNRREQLLANQPAPACTISDSIPA